MKPRLQRILLFYSLMALFATGSFVTYASIRPEVWFSPAGRTYNNVGALLGILALIFALLGTLHLWFWLAQTIQHRRADG